MYLTSAESESGPIMNVHEFLSYELQIDLNNPYIPTEEEIIGMLDEIDDVADNEPNEEIDNVQIG